MIDPTLRNEVIRRLLGASDSKLTAAEVDEGTSFRQDLDISSLILVTLATELEDELGIDIDDDDLSRIQTIGDLFRAIENSQRRKPRPNLG
jgi:acyl carrier protein